MYSVINVTIHMQQLAEIMRSLYEVWNFISGTREKNGFDSVIFLIAWPGCNLQAWNILVTFILPGLWQHPSA